MRKIIIEELKREIESSSKNTAIYVGCDSRRFKKKGIWHASYTRVVIIHMEGNKGCQVYGENKVERDYSNIRLRMLNEVYYSVEVASLIAESVGEREFQIHLDVNPSPEHASNSAVKEAIGYCRGVLGFALDKIKIKPNSFGASKCADRWA